MRIGVIGMSYKSSDLALREPFIKAVEIVKEKDPSLVVLATCNRIEIYFSSKDLAETHSSLFRILQKTLSHGFENSVYSYFGEKCFIHLALVISGADSVIFGETEIQRQVKQAYLQAAMFSELSSSLHFLFQKALKIGKQIRTSHIFPKTKVSVESTVLDVIRCFFGNRRDLSILCVGYSEINRKISSFLKNQGILSLSLATRSQILLDKTYSAKIDFNVLSTWVDYDVVICASNSSGYLLTAKDVQERLIANRLVIDLSVPRNVDPQICRHPFISLFNIEELSYFMDEKQKGYLQMLGPIKEVIEKEACRQFHLGCFKEEKKACMLSSSPS